MQHEKNRPRFICPTQKCEKSCTTVYNLREHLREIHGMIMTLDELKTCNKPLTMTEKGKMK